MDDLITRHSEIMDASDPDKHIGLVVDEWGTWFDVEKGTNPGFLYQQSTLRDALVAALNFHIFHKHAGRVVMANIAQMVNVLQSMVLTDGEKMLVTPTYWVFEMYKVHQGAAFLPVELQTPEYQFGGATVPMISASASRDTAGAVHLSLVNTDPNRPATLSCELRGLSAKAASGAVLTAAAMNSHNTFETPETVHPQPFNGASVIDGKLSVAIPSQSVVMLELH
jgi:alpha-N-arabinofuranosidase